MTVGLDNLAGQSTRQPTHVRRESAVDPWRIGRVPRRTTTRRYPGQLTQV